MGMPVGAQEAMEWHWGHLDVVEGLAVSIKQVTWSVSGCPAGTCGGCTGP